MSKLWLFLNRTPATKPKPELNKAALEPPGDFAREQFWKKKQNQPTKHKNQRKALETGRRWSCHGDSRSDSEGAGQGDRVWVVRSPKPRCAGQGPSAGGTAWGQGPEPAAVPQSCPGIPAGHGFPGDRQGRAPHTSQSLNGAFIF